LILKNLKLIICGLLILSVLSIACAGAANKAEPAEIVVMEKKVAASSIASSGMDAGYYYPEFEKISVDPAYQYLELKPGDSKTLLLLLETKTIKLLY